MRAGPVCDREDYPDHGHPARSHRGSPGPQSAPSTQTIWGALRLRFPRLKRGGRGKAKQNKPGEEKGRVTVPDWHLRPPSVHRPSLPPSHRRGPGRTPRTSTPKPARPPGRPQSPGLSPRAAPFSKGLPTGQHSHPRPRERAKWR